MSSATAFGEMEKRTMRLVGWGGHSRTRLRFQGQAETNRKSDLEDDRSRLTPAQFCALIPFGYRPIAESFDAISGFFRVAGGGGDGVDS